MTDKYNYDTLGRSNASDARLTLENHPDRLQTVDIVDAYGSSPAILDRKKSHSRLVRPHVDKSTNLSELPAQISHLNSKKTSIPAAVTPKEVYADEQKSD